MLERPGEVLTRDELAPAVARRDVRGLRARSERGRETAARGARRQRRASALRRDAASPRLSLHRRRSSGVTGGSAAPALRRCDRCASSASPCSRSPTCRATAGHEYFTEGLTEEMISAARPALRRPPRRHRALLVHGLQRTSTRVREIGAGPARRLLVEGTVRRDGDRVRITAQLIEPRGETQLWAESYERHLSDCFPSSPTSRRRSCSRSRWSCCRIGRHAADGHTSRRRVPGLSEGPLPLEQAGRRRDRQGHRLLRQALTLDRRSRRAHARSAARTWRGRTITCASRVPRSTRRGASAARALELDPTDSEAHLVARRRPPVPRVELARRGTGIPTRAGAQSQQRGGASPLRRAARRAAAGRRCRRRDRSRIELDPLCLIVGTSAAWVRYVAGDYDEVDRAVPAHDRHGRRASRSRGGCSPPRSCRRADVATRATELDSLPTADPIRSRSRGSRTASARGRPRRARAASWSSWTSSPASATCRRTTARSAHTGARRSRRRVCLLDAGLRRTRSVAHQPRRRTAVRAASVGSALSSARRATALRTESADSWRSCG